MVPRLQGAFSTVVMTKDSVVAFRDGAGLRPLSLGILGDRYCVASETCAFDIIGARFLRDVQPGEVVSLSSDGIGTRMAVAGARQAVGRARGGGAPPGGAHAATARDPAVTG